MSELAQRIAALSPEQREILLRGLAKARPAGRDAEAVLPRLVPRPEEKFEPFPLTDVQQVYWAGRSGFFDLPTPGPGATVYLEYDIPGDETFAPVFEQAFQRLFDRHEMLRAVMLPDGRQQYLRDLPEWKVEQIDLRWLSAEEVEARLEQGRERFRYHPGKVGQWPLFGFLAHILDGGRLRLHAWLDAWLIDGLSRDNLVRDLMRILRDPNAELPPLTCTYRDYALAWQEMRQTDLYRQSRDYWQARIPSLPPPPELPLSEVPRPETPVRFTAHTFELLPPEDWSALKATAARRGLTPTTPLLAAFSEVLRAWSRTPRFTFGLDGTYWPPIHPQLREIVGNFNTIHLVAADDLGGTFASRALGLQGQLTDALDNCLFSGHRVLREMNRLHGGSPRALMPVLFNSLVEFSHPAHQARNAPPAEAAQPAAAPQEAPAVDIVQVEITANLPQVLITAAVFEGEGGRLDGRFQTAEDFFPPGLTTTMREAFTELVRRLAQDEAAWEEARFRFAGSLASGASAAAPEAPATLHGLVAAAAAGNPEKEAVAAPDRVLTYGELMRRAEDLADRLRGFGAGPGQPVAVLLERDWQQAVSVLGTLGSGAVCLPLDAATPPDELRQALRRAGVRLAVARTETGVRVEWPEGVRWLTVDDGAAATPSAPPSAVEPEEAYAAGSAVISHRAAVHTLRELVRRLGITRDDRLASLSPPGSDLALYEILAPLAAGATVVLPAAGGSLEGWSAGATATVWSGPPAVIDALLARLPGGAAPQPRQIVLARGTVPLGLPDRLRRLAPSARISVLRGFPEAAGVSAITEVGETEPGAVRVPTGEPLAGHSLHVLDSDQEPRPNWVPGDLYVSTGGRLLRTGYVGRSLPGGEVEILERQEDFAVEIAGAFVELRRVEAALERHPAVRAAVVQAWPDPEGRRRLAAWVVPASGATLEAEALAAHLRQSLPAYLVPAWFQEMASLPLDAAGEVDRAALPPIDCSWRHPRERDLAALWREVLGASGPIGAADDFFSLGGDSFSAARMLVSVRERFGREIDLAAFFAEPTVRQLAGLLGREPEAAAPAQPTRTEIRRVEAAVPAQPVAATKVPVWERWMDRMLPSSVNRGMRNFVIIWLGQFVSAVGTGLGSFALGVWLFEQTQSATSFAMMGFVAGVILILMSPVAGALADRMDRRKLLLLADLGSGLTTLAMAFLLMSGLMRPWHVYPLISLMVTFLAIQGPALTASVSMLVPRSQLARASGMSQTSRALAQIIGPLMAGALVGRIGYHGVILIDFATFLFAITTLLMVRIPLPPGAGDPVRRSLLSSLTFGWSYLRGLPGLFALLSLFAMTNFCMGMVQALLTPLILSFATPVELGSVSSAGAGGALLGGLTLAIWGGPRKRVLGILLLLISQALLLFLGGVQPSIPLIALASFAFMFTVPFVNGFNQVILQSKVAPEVQGRVFAVAGMLAAATLPLASLVAGPLADKVFGPMLSPGGALADSVGQVIGVGDGRGVGFLFILLGTLVLLFVGLASLNPRLRRLETELPDALPADNPAPVAGHGLQNA